MNYTRNDAKVSQALSAHFERQTLMDQQLLDECIYRLSNGIKGVGQVTALEILWSVGRVLQNVPNEDIARPE